MNRKFIPLLLAALLLAAGWKNPLCAQNLNDSVRIFFHQGKAAIDPTLYNNRTALVRLQQMLTDTCCKQAAERRLQISGWTSPEGGEILNKRLAEKRARAIWQHVAAHSVMPHGQQPVLWSLDIRFAGTDWQRLRQLMLTDPQLPYADEAQQLLAELTDSGPSAPDAWLAQFKKLPARRTYDYAYRHLFPALRSATVRLVCLPHEAVRRADTVWVVKHDTLTVHDTLTIRDTLVLHSALTDKPLHSRRKRPLFVAVKTNLLFDALVIPNLGLEWMVSKQWSLAANWMYTWIKCDHKHRYWRAYGGELELNRRLGKKTAKASRLAGHHVGLYAQMLTYDVEWGARGYLGDKWSWGGGLTYGYALPVARRLNLDFTLNVGYLGGKYKEYLPKDGHYVWQRTRRMRWVGPTKVGIHLVWLVGRGNSNG